MITPTMNSPVFCHKIGPPLGLDFCWACLSQFMACVFIDFGIPYAPKKCSILLYIYIYYIDLHSIDNFPIEQHGFHRGSETWRISSPGTDVQNDESPLGFAMCISRLKNYAFVE